MVPYYYGTDVEYANKRLQHTLVYSSKKKDLVYIQGVIENPEQGVQIVANLVSDIKAPLDLSPEDIDLEPIPLGYCFLTKKQKSIFLTRIPMRSAYRQGLALNCMNFSGFNKSDLELKDLFMPAFNSYPTLDSAKKAIKKFSSMPFSRHFALDNKEQVLYRGRWAVGRLDAKGYPILDSKYGYLQQHLDSLIK